MIFVSRMNEGASIVPATAVCAAHHLHGLHLGFVRVRVRAPDDLVWELGERADC